MCDVEEDMGNKVGAEVKAHPLSKDPDKCFVNLRSEGKYKNLRQEENIYDIEKQANSIRFVCISDTHGKTERLVLDDLMPDGDVLIHAGDFTASSTRSQINHFNEFLGRVKHKYSHVVVIAGNHEVMFDPSWNNTTLFGRRVQERISAEDAKQLLTNCTYLDNELIELYGIKIYGSPWTPEFCDLGFNGERGEQLLQIWNEIPSDTDILMTHGPPLGIGDKCSHEGRVGCAELLTTIMDRVKPRYHIFGHIHEDYGIWNDGVTTYINASTCNRITYPANKPIVFDYMLSGT